MREKIRPPWEIPSILSNPKDELRFFFFFFYYKCCVSSTSREHNQRAHNLSAFGYNCFRDDVCVLGVPNLSRDNDNLI